MSMKSCFLFILNSFYYIENISNNIAGKYTTKPHIKNTLDFLVSDLYIAMHSNAVANKVKVYIINIFAISILVTSNNNIKETIQKFSVL